MRLNGIHWRSMTAFDLPAVIEIADVVHPGFFERPEILAERQKLYPDGARLLELGGVPAGYIFTHPWPLETPPALDTLLGRLPDGGTNYYIHDLALLPAARGTGAARLVVGDIVRHARMGGFTTISLVAVNDSQRFWQRHGFHVRAAIDLTEKLASYDTAARLMVKLLV